MSAGADVSAAADSMRLTGVPMAAADTLIAAFEAERTKDRSFVGDTGGRLTSARQQTDMRTSIYSKDRKHAHVAG